MTVPAGKRWLLQAVSATFFTDATVANRLVKLKLKDPGGNKIAQAHDGFNQVASTTVRRYWSRVAPVTGTVAGGGGAFDLAVALPSIELWAGSTIGTLTDLLKAGDSFQEIRIYAEEWDA